MKLRGKLLALSLLTLLLPWSAWKLLQEVEGFLRASQEEALLASARTMTAVIPLGYQTRLLFLPADYAPLRRLPRAPLLDGYDDDWPDAGQAQSFVSARGDLAVGLLAGAFDDRLYLLFEVRGTGLQPGAPAPRGRLVLEARGPRGLARFTVDPGAPGPLQLSGDGRGAGQLEGYWLERADGYRVELRLPVSASDTELRFEVQQRGAVITRVRGPSSEVGDAWIGLVEPWDAVSRWMAASGMDAARSWLVGPGGWVLADSQAAEAGAAAGAEGGGQRTTWVQRTLYRIVAGPDSRLVEGDGPDHPLRLDTPVVRRALDGATAAEWTRERETAVVRNTVAVPVELEGAVRGALVMQSTSDGLLLMTNRAMGRLLFTTLALALALAAALWWFASRLSRRVQRLGGAVSRAMEDGADPQPLPLVRDRDELGELARNNEKLLRAVREYGAYLQTLASKLSHELKTPLAITRSSLDNLASRDLDPETQRFLERAREGVERQAAIVRAMSEASRLEAAIGAADWAEVDLVGLLQGLGEGYRAVHPERDLRIETPAAPCRLRCAPDLLAQALDKLVDNALSLSGPEDAVTVVLEPAERHVDLAVRNTGSRLPDELRERLFDSLVSLREKRGAAPHLGLGLYIVRLVAAAHDGTVTARNLPREQGVEFRMRLPLPPAGKP